MTKKNRIHTDHSFALGWESGHIEAINDGYHVGYRGLVLTRSGLVQVDSMKRRDGYQLTALRFILNGRVRDRFYHEIFQPRTLTTLAKQFVADCIEQEPS